MFKLLLVSNRHAFISEGGSADYIVTGAWSAKAVKEVNYKKDIWSCSVKAIKLCFSFMYLTKQPQRPYWENVLQISWLRISHEGLNKICFIRDLLLLKRLKMNNWYSVVDFVYLGRGSSHATGECWLKRLLFS